jgi:preprotein translocase, YajC subunit
MTLMDALTLFGETQAKSGTTNGGTGGSMITMILLYGVIIAVFYFILIRPQSKQKKKEEEMRNSLEVGDTIVTIGGIVGRVVSVKDDDIVIETGADRNKLKIKKWAIGSNDTKRATQKTDDKKEGEKKGLFSFLKK